MASTVIDDDGGSLPEQSLRRQVFRGGAFLAARQVIGMVVSTAGMLIVTQRIGPDNYGLFIATMGLFTFFNLVAQSGLDVFLIRREGETDDRDDHVALTLLLMLGIAGSALGYFGAPLLQRYADAEGIAPLIRVAFAAMPMGLVAVVAGARLERALNFRLLAVVELAGVIVMQSLSVICAFSGFGAWAPITGWLAQQLLSAILLFALAGYRPRLMWDTARVRKMMYYGLSYACSMWIWQSRLLLNSIIVLPWAGAAAVAHVGIAMRFVEVLSFVKTTTWRVAIAALPRLKGDVDRIVGAINEGMRLQMLAVGPMLAGFAVLAPFVLPVFFRSRWGEWEEALDIFPYIAAGALVNAMFSMHSSSLFLLRRSRLVAAFHTANVVLFFVAAGLFVPRYGVIGVGYAEFVAMASYVLVHFFTVRVLKRSPDYSLAVVWGLSLGLLLFVHQIGWIACVGVVASALWPRTWHALDGYLKMLRPERSPAASIEPPAVSG